MRLPDEFLNVMKNTLKDDYEEYYEYLEKTPYRGLRVNTLKSSVQKVKDNIGIDLCNTPFCKQGFYIDNNIKGLGNHPFHHAGAIYLQEPSALSAATALDIKEGEKVLDLCAAPGGKSTQIAALLNEKGLLWSNEIVSSRAKILLSNFERCGVRNAVVSNAHPNDIAEELEGFFDKVLVDAPCSGEGMIRREPNAVSEWKIENRQMCADRQLKILESACKCVKSGGILVYSTCTLSGEENELVINQFTKSHPEFVIDEIPTNFGRKAYKHFCDNPDITKCRRILFMDGGEGHFVARLRKTNEASCKVKEITKFDNNKIFDEFYDNLFNSNIDEYIIINNIVYLIPKNMPKTTKIHILSAGVKAGEILKNRFVPSHALYMSRKIHEIKSVLDLDLNDNRINDFLHGLEIDCDKKGYTAVAVDGIVCGFGKASNGKLKNHYPKGLRIL